MRVCGWRNLLTVALRPPRQEGGKTVDAVPAASAYIDVERMEEGGLTEDSGRRA